MDKDQVNTADKLRPATSALGPDARARTTVALRDDGSAKNLYLYAWFVYRLYPVAEQQALATLEFALRERLSPLFPD